MSKALVIAGCAAMVVCGLLWGCAETERDILATSQPWDGRFYQKAPDGRMVQVTVWEHQKLVSCWEWDDDNVGNPQRKWVQTVTEGEGIRTVYDKDGRHGATEWYSGGEVTRGMH